VANYFVAYHLTVKTPSREEDIDEHLQRLGRLCIYRVLEDVWYVKYPGTADQLAQYVDRILSDNERLLVIDANDCRMRNLFVPNPIIQNCWIA
jgi:hypothetical protein